MERDNLIAVYGTLRYGMSNNHVMGGAEYIGTTVVPCFHMRSFGGFPVLVPSNANDRAVVELWRCSDEEMANVDILESYPDFYDRKEVDLENGYRAWIYFQEEEDVLHLPEAAKNLLGEYDWLEEVRQAA